MNKVYDLIILGSGPAGLTAAIYAERARLSTLTIEKNYVSGGQIIDTYEVDNYPGFPGINGFDLAMKFREHADQLGCEFFVGDVSGLVKRGSHWIVQTPSGEFETKAVLIASGAKHRKLGAPGEEELSGKGVSYCATCDGAFYRDKVVAVVGGGDVALEDAIFLSRMAKKVYLIHRRDSLRGIKSLQEDLFKIENIEVVWDSVIEEIQGDKKVENLLIKNVKTQQVNALPVDGCFIAVGTVPEIGFLPKEVALSETGYILAPEEGTTNVNGLFVAGDVREKVLRQIITASSDGANAVRSVENYIRTID